MQSVTFEKIRTRNSRIKTGIHILSLKYELLLYFLLFLFPIFCQELAMHDALASRGSVQYDQYSVEQQFELQQAVRSFVRGETEDIEVCRRVYIYIRTTIYLVCFRKFIFILFYAILRLLICVTSRRFINNFACTAKL